VCSTDLVLGAAVRRPRRIRIPWRESNNPACGDMLKLIVGVRNGRMAEMHFPAKGGVPAMACGSLLTELVQGRTLKEARKLRREELVQAIGGLPEASSHAGHLAIDALAAALKEVKG